MSDQVLSVREVVAGYDGATVIRDITLEVGAGEVVSMLGVNGAGKTTTLRVVSGLVRPMSGEVSFQGERVDTLAPAKITRLAVAHVPEGRGIFASLTVDEHFRLRYPGQKLDTAYAFSYFPELERLGGRRAGLLSGGEQQMLALARALAARPTLLMVDELSLGLAPIIVERLLPVLQRYAQDTGAGVLIVEQHVEMALRHSNRAYVLAHGEIQLERPAAELLASSDMLVASYMGESSGAQ